MSVYEALGNRQAVQLMAPATAENVLKALND
jgi:hypothetical protein